MYWLSGTYGTKSMHSSCICSEMRFRSAGSSLFITSLSPGRFSVLHLLTGWTLMVLPLAVIWARRHDVVRHRRVMMGLFYGGFAINLIVAFIPGRTLWSTFFG